jgi:hypothetical protein
MAKRLIKILVGVACAAAVLVLSPWRLFGPSFDFGTEEMRAAVEGTWQLTVERTDGTSRELTFTLRQAADEDRTAARGLVGTAAACGKRSLVRTAGACLDRTVMPLELRLVRGDAGDASALTASLQVWGPTFSRGALILMRGKASWEEAEIFPDGRTRVLAPGPGERSARLVRVARR